MQPPPTLKPAYKMRVKSEAHPPARFMRRAYPLAAMPSYEWRADVIAHHEAGHAVFCEMVGIPYTAIEMEADKGRVHLDNEAIQAAPQTLLTDHEKEHATCLIVAMYCAGLQAELLLLGLPLDGVMLPDDTDHREARRRLMEQFGSITPLGYCQHVARAALSRRWGRVKQLAAQLLQEGRLEFNHEQHKKTNTAQM